MTCHTGTALVLLLSLCGVPAAGAATAASGATLDASTVEASPANAAFLAEVGAALQQSDAGDSLGAAITLDRLLVDPRMAQLEVAQRSDVWASAAMVSGAQKQDDIALQRLQQALAINPHNAYARLRLAWTQMVDGTPENAADNVILARRAAGHVRRDGVAAGHGPEAPAGQTPVCFAGSVRPRVEDRRHRTG
jgi:thioredoxin-like negative regulator of GroEL